MPNDLRSDLYPEEVHLLPRLLARPRSEAAVLGNLWEDFGDPDFPEATSAVLHMLQPRRRER
jgi:hypothetical protein